MAEAFIGMTVGVTLREPAHVTLIGKVVNIQGQTLCLENVLFPQSGRSLSAWNVSSTQIADLQVVESMVERQQLPSMSQQVPSRPGSSAHATATLPIRPANGLADPAILSYHRPPSQPLKDMVESVATAVQVSPVEIGESRPEKLFNDAQVAQQDQTPVAKPKKTKGWRSTPLLEETPQASQTDEASPSATRSKKNVKGKKKAQRAQEREMAQNGWATEEATDLGDDFDFEANLLKFDKRTVFDQIRNEDTTADEDRLVSHNRLARPGTYGGKNLHHTEMVLSPPLKPQASEPGSLSEADTEVDFASGRNSRQSMRSRTSSKHPPPRTGSVQIEGRSLSRALRAMPSVPHPLNASIMSADSNRSNSSLRNAPLRGGSQPVKTNFPHLRTRHTQQIVYCIAPERLRQLEQEVVSTFGLHADAVSELCARAIAQSMTSSAARAPTAGRRNSKESVTARGSISAGPKQTIVVLAGNHNKGARAIAAVRHLYGRHKTLVSVLNYDRPATWNTNVAKQIRTTQSLGRKAGRLHGWPSTLAQIKRLNSPPALIVDAILDGSKYGEISDAQQAVEVREMIDWMNRSRAGVISIDCPSGYDANTGETTILEGEPLAVKPDRVLSLGAPVSGVLEAAQSGENWAITVMDIGMAPVMKDFEAVPFASEWTLDVEFTSGDS